MNKAFRDILAIFKVHLIEVRRNYQIVLTNVFLPLLFFFTSFFIEKYAKMNYNEMKLLINCQFLMTSLLFGILSYSFSNPLQNLVEFREEKADLLLSQTDIKWESFFLGQKLADILVLNLHVLFVLLLFSTLSTVSDVPYIKLFLLTNIAFFSINPLVTFIGNKIRNTKVATNFGTLLILVLIFSLTFTSMFSTLFSAQLDFIVKILLINPMFGYYDTVTNLLLTPKYYFGSFTVNIVYMLVYSIFASSIELIFIKKRGII